MQLFGSIKAIEPAGIDGMIIYFNGESLTDQNNAVQGMARGLKAAALPWVKALIAGYDSLLVLYDLQRADSHKVYQTLRNIAPQVEQPGEHDHHTLPVWYGAPEANDLATIAAHTGLSQERIIALHSGQDYRVFTVGFSPGFGYMGELDPQLSCPRLDSPRTRVPAGAVAIADRQTAIYPSASPGGWHLLGLCPLPLYRPDASQAVTLKAGDTVAFEAIDEFTFRELYDAHH